MLRHFGSYSSYGEISAILGVPVGTVRSRLNQVKIKLAEAMLKTAGLEHIEARQLTESQTRFFEAGFDEYNRGLGYGTFIGSMADDLSSARSDGFSGGIGWLVEGLEDDLEVGMKLHLTNVIASKDVTVVEGDFENPPADPYHCPPRHFAGLLLPRRTDTPDARVLRTPPGEGRAEIPTVGGTNGAKTNRPVAGPKDPATRTEGAP
jgi:hypothetical protein